MTVPSRGGSNEPSPTNTTPDGQTTVLARSRITPAGDNKGADLDKRREAVREQAKKLLRDQEVIVRLDAELVFIEADRDKWSPGGGTPANIRDALAALM
jgi:hypothetical protein